MSLKPGWCARGWQFLPLLRAVPAAAGRLRIRGANGGGETFYVALNTRVVNVIPGAFVGEDDFKLPFLTRFGGKLSPEEMRADLVFTAAPDNEAFRESVTVW